MGNFVLVKDGIRKEAYGLAASLNTIDYQIKRKISNFEVVKKFINRYPNASRVLGVGAGAIMSCAFFAGVRHVFGDVVGGDFDLFSVQTAYASELDPSLVSDQSLSTADTQIVQDLEAPVATPVATVEETTVVQDAPAVEVAPAEVPVEQAPVSENSVATEEVAVVEEAPAMEAVPASVDAPVEQAMVAESPVVATENLENQNLENENNIALAENVIMQDEQQLVDGVPVDSDTPVEITDATVTETTTEEVNEVVDLNPDLDKDDNGNIYISGGEEVEVNFPAPSEGNTSTIIMYAEDGTAWLVSFLDDGKSLDQAKEALLKAYEANKIPYNPYDSSTWPEYLTGAPHIEYLPGVTEAGSMVYPTENFGDVTIVRNEDGTSTMLMGPDKDCVVVDTNYMAEKDPVSDPDETEVWKPKEEDPDPEPTPDPDPEPKPEPGDDSKESDEPFYGGEVAENKNISGGLVQTGDSTLADFAMIGTAAAAAAATAGVAANKMRNNTSAGEGIEGIYDFNVSIPIGDPTQSQAKRR